jgi:hypothetical protein
MRYIKNIMIAVDQLFNCILGGMPDETISAKVWRMRDRHIIWEQLRITIDILFWFDDNHCRESYESELYRKQISSEYKGNKK